MTTKPNIAPSRATNYVVTATDWDNDVQQSQNYFLEVLGGTNSDKVPGSAIANPVSLGTVNASQVNGPIAGAVAATTLSASGASTLQAVSGTTGTFSGQVQSNGVNVRRMTGGVATGIAVPSNGNATWTVTLDDAITPTRAVATVFYASSGSVIFNAQVTSLGSGTVSGVVNCNGAGATVSVHVIAY